MDTTPTRSRTVRFALLSALLAAAACGGGPGSDPNSAYLFAGGAGAGGSSGTNPNMMRGPASQSSVGWGGDPDRAIDGNDNGDYWGGSVTHTQLEGNPWWMSSTHQELPGEFRVYNRTDCCGERLGRFEVFFRRDRDGQWVRWREFDMAGLATLVVPIPDNDWGLVNTIFIRKIDEGYLSLAEVQLFRR
jgi:hypothetical protein